MSIMVLEGLSPKKIKRNMKDVEYEMSLPTLTTVTLKSYCHVHPKTITTKCHFSQNKLLKTYLATQSLQVTFHIYFYHSKGLSIISIQLKLPISNSYIQDSNG